MTTKYTEIRYERPTSPNGTDVVYVPVNERGIVEVDAELLHQMLIDLGFKKAS